jgi:hypothetical protein
MNYEPRYLEIRQTGKRLVVAFRETEVWDFKFVAGVEDELDHIVHNFAFDVLAFDLAGMQRISSMLIGIFVSLTRTGFAIELVNPTSDVREVLETLHLDGLIAVEPRQTPS